MAQPANPKIEELRARLKADPKSRLFYQLAEELRRTGQSAEAEQVLRSGVEVHPAYLAPWVSLGRVLRERKDDRGAVEALQRALQLDPGNVVAARLLGEAHLALGEKVEAIKKFKLVHALLPGDEEIEATIVRLDRELNPPQAVALSEAPETTDVTAEEDLVPAEAEEVTELPSAADEPAFGFAAEAAEPEPDRIAPAFAAAVDVVRDEPVAEPAAPASESPFDKTLPPFAEVADSFERAAQGSASGQELPAESSPFDEPDAGAEPERSYSAYPDEDADAEGEAPSVLPQFSSEHGDPAETATMADLYARQGLASEARRIYAKILDREPENAEIRAKLAAIDGPQSAPSSGSKVVKLEKWLARISGKEAGRV
jgi:tetratricopeptide (TPR) repeat protein